jgi:predicted DNA-binding protein
MAVRSHMSRMTIDVPEEDHKRLKALAAILGKSMREIIMEWIHEHLYSSNTPNAETLDAIKQIERGDNLIESDNIDDLFKKLGI